ncbi:TIGR00341 family protein [Larsenimonas rhizosphaerae]|uniref:TIGR00341 family protein n=1 Tax=Larsenimonas rhizosphaerae TaxID=2944682 RepID=A0AA41ZJA2_9GAMM|nr:TIGR00341 family protein [Larsenimonas rhizosphaerae]MCM2131366.1 TIGR00341 family protein [Larsenimonas rhizosphaerae]MCX2525269.1 TIGR00341 family protein [Larsenimonas rhizosphaerae]
MSNRLIQLIASEDDSDTITSCFEKLELEEWWKNSPAGGGERVTFYVALHQAESQEVMDALGEALKGKDDWRLFSLATEANLPEVDDEDEQERLEQKNTASAREEIYGDIRSGATLTRDYLLMTALATCVAAIGLNQGQVAVVIGAMVIAPLLGPILAFAFGSTLGNLELLWIAARSLLAGLGVSIAVGILLGFLYRATPDNQMMNFSGVMSLQTLMLPLASGAAAALMVAGGKMSALVGVMVAAALLPPLAAFGLFIGDGNYLSGGRALVSVVVNIIAINLAAQVVFLLKGIRPKRWDTESRGTSVKLALGVSAGLAVVAGLFLWLSGSNVNFSLL